MGFFAFAGFIQLLTSPLASLYTLLLTVWSAIIAILLFATLFSWLYHRYKIVAILSIIAGALYLVGAILFFSPAQPIFVIVVGASIMCISGGLRVRSAQYYLGQRS
jgi:hypothetical protein